MDMETQQSSYFEIVKDGFVGELIMNRPNQLNSMDDTFFVQFQNSIASLDQDDDTRVILVWSRGKIFTAGLDLKAASGLLLCIHSTADKETGSQQNLKLFKLIKKWQASFTALQKINKPVIIAIHNKCIGGGLDLATACDIRLCTQDASFSVAETKLAIVPDLGTLQRLTYFVGKGIAREMMFTGEPMNATRAANLGLVNRVYENQDQLLKGAREMAKIIANNSPLVVQAIKKLLNVSENLSVQDSLELVALWNSSFLKSPDLSEALRAFMTKSVPTFNSKL